MPQRSVTVYLTAHVLPPYLKMFPEDFGLKCNHFHSSCHHVVASHFGLPRECNFGVVVVRYQSFQGMLAFLTLLDLNTGNLTLFI